MLMINELTLFHPIILYVALGLLSLMVGSLLNVIIYRLPLMLQAEWTLQCKQLLDIPQTPTKNINLFYPRSFCPGCKKLIHAWQNIPLLSFILLGGRCAQCKQRIPLRYPFVEALTLSLSLVAGGLFGFNETLLFVLPFIWILITLCMIDLAHQLLPDSLTLGLLWLGLIANTHHLFTTLPNAVLTAAAAYLGLWLFIKLYFLATGKIGMGNGDFKLFAALGACFGWTALIPILLISSISGALIGITYLKISQQSNKTPIPFGPFLCFAGLVVLFFNSST